MAAFKKILLPTDFSARAGMAFAQAVRLAASGDAEVIVQHVIDNSFEENSHWPMLLDTHELQKIVHGYVSFHMARIFRMDSGRVRLRSLISNGRPANEIATAADRELVDLIVMGSAGGVITNEVIRITRRPVLSVPAYEGHLHKLTKILVAVDFSGDSKRVMAYAFDLKRTFNATIYVLHVIEPHPAIEWAIKPSHVMHAAGRP